MHYKFRKYRHKLLKLRGGAEAYNQFKKKSENAGQIERDLEAAKKLKKTYIDFKELGENDSKDRIIKDFKTLIEKDELDHTLIKLMLKAYPYLEDLQNIKGENLFLTILVKKYDKFVIEENYDKYLEIIEEYPSFLYKDVILNSGEEKDILEILAKNKNIPEKQIRKIQDIINRAIKNDLSGEAVRKLDSAFLNSLINNNDGMIKIFALNDEFKHHIMESRSDLYKDLLKWLYKNNYW